MSPPSGNSFNDTRRRMDPTEMLMVPSARENQRRQAKQRAGEQAPKPGPGDTTVSAQPLDDLRGPGGTGDLADPDLKMEEPIDQSATPAPVQANTPPQDDTDDEDGSFDLDDQEMTERGSRPDAPINRADTRPNRRPPADDDDEVPQETERWAPETLADTVIDVEKKCRLCGKDLKGHRRFKDERGYLCKDCEREDRIRRIPCAECGKAVPPEALRPWGPISICARCWADHQNDPKLRIKRKVSTKKFEMVERQNVLIIAAVAALLLLIILIAQLS